MITGHVPFSAFDEEAILAQHLQEAVKPPSQSRAGVPPDLEAIVLRLLEKDPSNRFASARDVCDGLEQIILERKAQRGRGNLRALSKEFVGPEVEQIKQLLESNRLVTYLGDNEALALTVGTQLADQFQDGAWVVNLEMIPNPGLVLSAVATRLNVLASPNRSLAVSLVEYLQEKNLLLILTRCERVSAACAQLVGTILRTCPDVSVLGVSGKALGVVGERIVSSE
jgi:non-specific serine/threonine protein kinase